MRDAPCLVDDCRNSTTSGKKGMCGMHAQRVKRRGTTDAPPKRVRPTCSLDGCERPHCAHGYCAPHYRRFMADGDPGPVEVKAYNKTATRYENPRDGYVRIKVGDHPRASRGWVREHLIVMEAKIGRPLAPGEEVHHINGVKGDNRPENLELWVVSQPKGQRPTDLVDWAHEILRRYGGENDDRRPGS